MKKYYTIIFTGLFLFSTTASADLFFSEYIEGSAYNKALEIYNPFSKTVDLSDYSIKLYSNGRSSANSKFTLSGTIEAYGVFVIANKRSNSDILSIANETSNVVNFNGNDAVTLSKKGVVIDVIGEIGSNPGAQWGRKGLSTKNCTLRRKPSVIRGVSESKYPFDPSLEWDGFESDTFSGLGDHSLFVD